MFAARVPTGARVLELGCGGDNPSTLVLARRYDYLGGSFDGVVSRAKVHARAWSA